MVSQMKMAKATICPISVRLKFTLFLRHTENQTGQASTQSEHDVQAQTHTNHGNGVNQPHQYEEVTELLVEKFRLTETAFQQFTAQQADADRGADCGQTQQ